MSALWWWPFETCHNSSSASCETRVRSVEALLKVTRQKDVEDLAIVTEQRLPTSSRRVGPFCVRLKVFRAQAFPKLFTLVVLLTEKLTKVARRAGYRTDIRIVEIREDVQQNFRRQQRSEIHWPVISFPWDAVNLDSSSRKSM